MRSVDSSHDDPHPTQFILAGPAVSSHIRILAALLPLHILLVDQLVDILLDIDRLQRPPALGRLDRLGDQLLMPDRLAALHDAHNGRLSLVLPVRRHPLVRLLVLFLGLLELDRVDLDSVFRVLEPQVHAECVRVIDVPAAWVLGQWAEFGAREGLEGALDFGFAYW